MNLYPVASYLRHVFTARSTAGYGVHSPFMFDFLRSVVRVKTSAGILVSVEGLRHEMLHDDRIIYMMDLGTGVDRERKIRDIAGRDSLPVRYVSLLARIVHGMGYGVSASGRTGGGIGHERTDVTQSREAGEHGTRGKEQGAPGREDKPAGGQEGWPGAGCVEQDKGYTEEDGIILELGTSLGISTLAMSLAAPETMVVSVEGCPQLADVAKENLKRHGAGNALVLNMEFDDALEKLREEKTKVTFAFIDGNHRGEALKHYIRTIKDMGEEMIIVADDIHLNRDMSRAWRCLTQSGTAPATLETFHFGMIFFLNKMTPGRYRIRY